MSDYEKRIKELVCMKDVQRGYMFIEKKDMDAVKWWSNNCFRLNFEDDNVSFECVSVKRFTEQGCLIFAYQKNTKRSFCPFKDFSNICSEKKHMDIVSYAKELQNDVLEKHAYESTDHHFWLKYQAEVDSTLNQIYEIYMFNEKLSSREVQIIGNAYDMCMEISCKLSSIHNEKWREFVQNGIEESLEICIIQGKDVRYPERAHDVDAGIDVFVPNDCEKIVLKPGESCVIPGGIRAAVPTGYALIAHNKGGVASKKNLIHGACVTDTGYTGEIFYNMINVGTEDQTITPGDKILQLVMVRIGLHDVSIISEEEYERKYNGSERGDGSRGSTGN